MALKDWEKFDKYMIYQKEFIFIKIDSIKQWDEWDYVVTISEDDYINGKIIQRKYFKTKQQALRYAREYMRTH